MKITVFGMGYVGCVTAACFADRGHAVTGVDLDDGKTSLINAGRSPVIEPQLGELIERVVHSGRLRAVRTATELGDVVLVCVGTPSNSNGSLGLEQIKRVVTQIGELLRDASGYRIVCIRSTVLPGTVEEILGPILEQSSGKRIGADFGLCMNPEFLRETTAIKDFNAPPFTVIGANDARAAAQLCEIYAGIEAPVERTNIRVAETVKYACNAFHAVKVCFANEIGNFSKALGVDSHRVMEIFCKDTKLNLSPYYLKPGFAFGGSCLPKDLRAILYKARHLEVEMPLLASLAESNRRQIERAFDLVQQSGKRHIGVLGLSFKAGTDDLRESPIVTLVETMIGKGYKLAIHDDEVALARLVGANRRFIETAIPHISSLMLPTLREVIDGSEILIVAKNNESIREALATADSKKLVIDLVRAVTKPAMGASSYEGICW